MKKLELVGIREVAEILDASKQRVANYRDRYPEFPKPYAELYCGPIYLRQDILGFQKWKARRDKERADRRTQQLKQQMERVRR